MGPEQRKTSAEQSNQISKSRGLEEIATMKSGKCKFNIEKLIHGNYNTWNFMMKIILEYNGVWNIIEMENAENFGNAEYDWKQQKALQLISLNVDKSQVIHIRHAATGTEAWNALRAQHRRSSLGARSRVYRKISGSILSNGTSMIKHLDSLLENIEELREMGNVLSEGTAIGMIIGSLNSDYDGLVTALEAWEGMLTLEILKVKLVEEWERREALKQEAEKYRRAGTYGQVGRYGKNESESTKRYQGTELELGTKAGIYKQTGSDATGRHYGTKFATHAEGIRKLSKRNWLIDSGASSHMTGSTEPFCNFDRNHKSGIRVANGEIISSAGIGTVKELVNTEGGIKEIELREVLFVPQISDNLISVGKLTERGDIVEFERDGCYLRTGNDRVRVGRTENNVYKLNTIDSGGQATQSEEANIGRCVHDWHRRLAHRNLDDIRKMKRQGLEILECGHSDICEQCIKGKMARKPFPKKATPVEATLDCIVSDVCGAMQVESLGRKKYFVTFIDEFSGYCEVYFLRRKDDVTEAAIKFLTKIKTRFQRMPKVFRSDRGGEYLNKKLEHFLTSNGITPQCTVGYAPEQNGIAERKNRTLVEAARTMIADSGLPKTFWAEAIFNANYTLNCVLKRGTKKSPFETFYGRKPRYDKFHEFGSDVYVKIPDEKRRKLDDKAVKMKFIGYDAQSKGYRVVDENFKVTVSREVIFLDTKLPFKRKRDRNQAPGSHNWELEETPTLLEEGDYDSGVEYGEVELEPARENAEELPLEEDEDEFVDAEDGYDEESEVDEVEEEHTEVEQDEEEPQLRRSTRPNLGKRPSKLDDYVVYHTEQDENFEPKTYKQARNLRSWKHWKKAMEEELHSIEENDTWELTDLPRGRKAVGSKWVFKIKRDENGNILRHKARLVAQGFSQKFGIDYDEVFAPVARSTTLRILLSVAGSRNYHVKHYDIKTAFLNGKLDEEIYMKQPPGFQEGSKVYKLKKSLYGLKQAARVWNKTLHEELIANGFEQNQTDRCLYVKKEDGNICYLLIHVDDLLVAGNDETFIDRLMEEIGKRFEIKDLGGVKHYLGIDVHRDEKGRFLISQPLYIKEIIKEAGLEEAKTSKYPVDSGYYKQEGTPLESNEEYRKLIGMLLYLCTHTRPDIAASVAILSKKVASPRNNDLNEVKRVIRYLKGTCYLKLKLNDPHANEEIVAHSDANWAEDRDDRKSNSGFYCTLNGGAVSWSSRKQDIVTLSSAESEYVALAETNKEVTWLREVIKCFGIDTSTPITIFTDSQSCISMIRNQSFSNRTKHIDARYHYIRDQVTAGKIKLEYVPTAENLADILTKPLGRVKTEYLRKLMGLTEAQSQQFTS